MKEYKHEFITISVPTFSQTSYTVQTYDNINSVYIYNFTDNNTTNIEIGVNTTAIFQTLYIAPNKHYIIDGKKLQKLNAPIIIYAQNIGIHNPPGKFFVIIKRYV